MKTTSSQKKSNVVVKTNPDDVVYDVEDLTKFTGLRIAMMMYNDGIDIHITACEAAYDLPFYVAKNKAFPTRIASEDLITISVIVLDPENLPYEINDGEEVFVIYNGWNLSRHGSMEEAVHDVEVTIDAYIRAEIDDFVVLVGEEFPPETTQLFMNRISYCRAAMCEG